MGGAALAVRDCCEREGIGGGEGETEYMGFMGIAFPPTIIVLDGDWAGEAFETGIDGGAVCILADAGAYAGCGIFADTGMGGTVLDLEPGCIAVDTDGGVI